MISQLSQERVPSFLRLLSLPFSLYFFLSTSIIKFDKKSVIFIAFCTIKFDQPGSVFQKLWKAESASRQIDNLLIVIDTLWYIKCMYIKINSCQKSKNHDTQLRHVSIPTTVLKTALPLFVEFSEDLFKHLSGTPICTMFYYDCIHRYLQLKSSEWSPNF